MRWTDEPLEERVTIVIQDVIKHANNIMFKHKSTNKDDKVDDVKMEDDGVSNEDEDENKDENVNEYEYFNDNEDEDEDEDEDSSLSLLCYLS